MHPIFTHSPKTNFFCFVLLLSTFIASNAAGQIINTIAGIGTTGYSGDGGPATAAQLSNANGLATDSSGNLFIADKTSVRKVNTAGVIATIAGNGISCDSVVVDGVPATSTKVCPYRLAVGPAGNLYILDNGRVRKVDPAGIITTIAGGGLSSADGVPATAANLPYAEDIMFDPAGYLYVGCHTSLRKIDLSTGLISTTAGTSGSAGFSGDGGPATAAKVNYVAGVIKDASNNIYILDRGNRRVRKIDAAGVITTYAGNGNIGYSGDGGPATNAEFSWPFGMGIDGAGNLYVADRDGNAVRKIASSGTISTIAGVYIPGYSGDGGPSIAAQLNHPLHVTAAYGNLYIADDANRRVRMIAGVTGIKNTMSNNQCSVFPNPSTGRFVVNIPQNYIQSCTMTLYNFVGQIVYQLPLTSSSKEIDLSNMVKGVYFLKVSSEASSVVEKIVLE